METWIRQRGTVVEWETQTESSRKEAGAKCIFRAGAQTERKGAAKEKEEVLYCGKLLRYMVNHTFYQAPTKTSLSISVVVGVIDNPATCLDESVCLRIFFSFFVPVNENNLLFFVVHNNRH